MVVWFYLAKADKGKEEYMMIMYIYISNNIKTLVGIFCSMAQLRLRESQITKIHYLTGILALFCCACHILFRLIMPFGSSLSYQNVVANYHNIFYALLLEVHFDLDIYSWFQWIKSYFNELKQSPRWDST